MWRVLLIRSVPWQAKSQRSSTRKSTDSPGSHYFFVWCKISSFSDALPPVECGLELRSMSMRLWYWVSYHCSSGNRATLYMRCLGFALYLPCCYCTLPWSFSFPQALRLWRSEQLHNVEGICHKKCFFCHNAHRQEILAFNCTLQRSSSFAQQVATIKRLCFCTIACSDRQYYSSCSEALRHQLNVVRSWVECQCDCGTERRIIVVLETELHYVCDASGLRCWVNSQTILPGVATFESCTKLVVKMLAFFSRWKSWSMPCR